MEEEICSFLRLFPSAKLILGGDWNSIKDPLLNCRPPCPVRVDKTAVDKYCHGGLNVSDFNTSNTIFRINWFRGIEFLLNCYYSVDKLPVNLASFHKQALLSWMLVYKHNFSSHKCLIWNNQNIRYKNKSLFVKRWFVQNILFVTQLLNENGHLYNYTEFLKKYAIPITPKEFAIIFDIIPAELLLLCEEILDHS